MKLNISGVFTTAAKEVLLHQFNCDAEIGKSKMKNISQTVEDITLVLEVTGKIRGQVIYMMDKRFALEFASMMVGIPIIDIDELSMSAISEIGNIITGSAITKLSESGYYCETTIPNFIMGKDEPLDTIDSIGVTIPVTTPIGSLTIALTLQEY